jgi:hypothetical protein
MRRTRGSRSFTSGARTSTALLSSISPKAQAAICRVFQSASPTAPRSSGTPLPDSISRRPIYAICRTPGERSRSARSSDASAASSSIWPSAQAARRRTTGDSSFRARPSAGIASGCSTRPGPRRPWSGPRIAVAQGRGHDADGLWILELTGVPASRSHEGRHRRPSPARRTRPGPKRAWPRHIRAAMCRTAARVLQGTAKCLQDLRLQIPAASGPQEVGGPRARRAAASASASAWHRHGTATSPSRTRRRS